MMYVLVEAPKWKTESIGSCVGLFASILTLPMNVPCAEILFSGYKIILSLIQST